MAKTTCPITRPQFREGAKPVEVTINGAPMLADAREFSTGSLGSPFPNEKGPSFRTGPLAH